MTTANRGDKPIPLDELGRIIRATIDRGRMPTDRAGGLNRPRPHSGRPTTAPGRRIIIPGYDPTDPKLAEVLAELEAKRAEAEARRVDDQASAKAITDHVVVSSFPGGGE
jgi:hypothetical protein